MEIVVQDTKNKITISDEVFSKKFNQLLVHQVITSYSSNGRKGTKYKKNRSEVKGSNKKPWKQKGTGRARAGSKKSPIWRGGGVTFSSKEKSYTKKINKKMYKGAIKSILSELIRQNRLIVFEKFFINEPKTKVLLEKIKTISLKKILIIKKEVDKNLFLASKNLYKVKVQSYLNINPINLISFEKTIMTVNSIKKIEEILL